MNDVTERNRELIRTLYDAVSVGDLDSVLNQLADDVVNHEPAG